MKKVDPVAEAVRAERLWFAEMLSMTHASYCLMRDDEKRPVQRRDVARGAADAAWNYLKALAERDPSLVKIKSEK